MPAIIVASPWHPPPKAHDPLDPSLIFALSCVAAFVVAGATAGKEGVVMMLAATTGGCFGARWSRRVPVQQVCRGVIGAGLEMAALFFAGST